VHQSDSRESRVIVDFLRRTDHPLLTRIARRMVNHLCWNGVPEAHALLQRFSSDLRPAAADALDDNRPLARKSPVALTEVTEQAFQLASGVLSEEEIVGCIETWILDDKANFLIEVAENQCSALEDILAALDRYVESALEDRQLSSSTQHVLRVSLVRRFLSEDTRFIGCARHWIEVRDFCELAHRIVSPQGSRGKLGGKSSGLLLASHIVRKAGTGDGLDNVKVPKTWYITSDGILDFIEHNHLQDVYNRKYLDLDEIRREYPHIVQVFKNSHFTPEIVRGLSQALDDFGDRPIVVRSSSLLEDQFDAAFSGKYKSLFLANQGTKQQRLDAVLDAVAEVYASVFGPDPIEYRAERGLLDAHEEMGVMIQEVVGVRIGPYFCPAYAGVAFSRNEFRWSTRIRREDGLVRLVPGLGTRAVDRVADDYPILLAPGQPGLRVNVSADEVLRYSPKRIDVINLEAGAFETVDLRELLRTHGRDHPAIRQMVSVVDQDGLLRPAGFDWDPSRDRGVVTFEGLVRSTPFVARMRALLSLLGERMGGPVDLEFASDGTDLYLLQCRPQSGHDDDASTPVPRDVPPERVVFSAKRFVSNGRIRDLTHVVYVRPEAYAHLPDLAALREVGRAVGRLNKLLPKRQFALLGPGRWGSRGDIRLGVSVTYADISNTAILVEVARRRGGYVPDVSFGTHFFQDLVESRIRYLPLFPDDAGVAFNEAFLASSPSVLSEMLPEYSHLADVVRVIDVPRVTGGLVVRVALDADADEALAYLASPANAAATASHPVRREGSDEAARWRLRMAERLAADLDGERFGVRALYLIGSTKNGTARAESDIDLIVHVSGAPAQREALALWLDGWSRCLAEMNFWRTGVQRDGLLDVHLVEDDDIAQRRGVAIKLDAVTDPARPLPLASRARA
jgi:hypothetical protein